MGRSDKAALINDLMDTYHNTFPHVERGAGTAERFERSIARLPEDVLVDLFDMSFPNHPEFKRTPESRIRKPSVKSKPQ